VGEKILDIVLPLEIRRRVWVIKRFIMRMEKTSDAARLSWLIKREKSVYRVVDDLLELSSYGL
jgi:hypothetical protein